VTGGRFHALDLATTAGLAAAASLPLGLAWSGLRVGGIDPTYVREAQFVLGLLALLVATVASRPTRPGSGPESEGESRSQSQSRSRSQSQSRSRSQSGSRSTSGFRGDAAPTASDGPPIPDDVLPPVRLRVGLSAALTGRPPSPGDAAGVGAHAFAATGVLFALSLGIELLV